MAIATDEPSNGNLYRQTCSDRRVSVEIEGHGQFIPDIEIPTFNVETTISKEGVSDKNRLTEVRFPAEWRNKDVISLVNAFDPNNQERYDTAKVHFQSVNDGEWYTTHYGYVRSVGATSDGNELRLWISDPSDFLSAVPVNATYGVGTTVQQVFDDVAGGIESNTIFSDVGTKVLANEELIPSKTDLLADALSEPIFEQVETHEGPELVLRDDFRSSLRHNLIKGSRSFKANRDTLADVLSWVTDVAGGRYFFEHTDDDGLVLVYDQSIAQQLFTDHHTTGGTSVSVIENDAYQEILPVNSVTVNGQSRMSIKGFTELAKQGNIPLDGKWPTATAVYEPLVNRTGQQLAPPLVDTDAVTIEAAENMAKKELIERMRGTPMGDIKLYGEPRIEPRDQIRSVPICGGTLNTSIDIPPLSYEVERVIHRKEAGKEFETRVEVSLFIDTGAISVQGKLTDGSDDGEEESEEGSPLTFMSP